MKKILSLLIILCCTVCGYAQVAYKITGNGLEKPSYIFGTHHLAPLKVLTEDSVALDALNDAEQVVTEIDMTQDPQEMQMSMMPFMVAPPDSTLSKVLTKEQFEKVDKLFNELTGVSIAVIDAMRPMVASSNISMMLVMKSMPEYMQEQQLDSYISKTGVEQGKKLVPLETAAQQAQIMFASLPISEQAEGLVELADDPEKGLEMSKRLNEAYFNRDLDELLAISLEEDDNPEFMKKLLDMRNADWLRQLPSILSAGSTFIGVGALHLPGEQGIVEGLRKLGYTVEPLVSAD